MNTTNHSTFNELLQLAKKAADKAYAPYSKFHVGAALITEDGKTFSGCNVENASYGLTICAERNAISNMVAEGYKSFIAIAVYSPQSKNCYPCGACRQWIYEFSLNATIILEDDSNTLITSSIKELLPHAFGPDHLV